MLSPNNSFKPKPLRSFKTPCSFSGGFGLIQVLGRRRESMNTQQFLPLLFPVLIGMVIVWFVLIKILFNRLESLHPLKYEAMGRPSLFLRNNIATGWATLKFIVAREHKTLNDSSLSKLSDFMLVFFAIYLLLFFGLSFLVVGQSAPAA
jgi:hypothetical protein